MEEIIKKKIRMTGKCAQQLKNLPAMQETLA